MVKLPGNKTEIRRNVPTIVAVEHVEKIMLLCLYLKKYEAMIFDDLQKKKAKSLTTESLQ